jgi:hypothetical protein
MPPPYLPARIAAQRAKDATILVYGSSAGLSGTAVKRLF